jgi:AraC family transcriptional regulator
MKKPKPAKNAVRADRISPHDMPDYLPAGAYQSSGSRMDSDVQMQLYSHRSTAQSLIVPAVAEPLLVLVLSGSAVVQERESGKDWMANAVTADDFFLTMSDKPYEMRWQTQSGTEFQVVHVYLSQRLLDMAAQDILGTATNRVRLVDVSGARDSQVSQLIRLLHQEMSRHRETSTVYLHGVAQALAVHLVRHYRDKDVELKAANALPAYKLHRVIERMTEGLENSFSLTLLAAEAGMSDFHFSRLFRRATGQSPSQYFIQMRMEKARQLLRSSSLSIIDVALEVGYTSPGHFAHVFKRHTGQTPRDYRQR